MIPNCSVSRKNPEFFLEVQRPLQATPTLPHPADHPLHSCPQAMDSQKQFTGPEIQFLLSCSEADENEMINFEEFANRFQEPARDIGFNVAVLLTNLSEHVPHDPRLRNFLELAESILEYFRPYLGRIEIMGSSRRIERIYFEISETNRAQWEMPQVGGAAHASLAHSPSSPWELSLDPPLATERHAK